jgi:hypothetical protein
VASPVLAALVSEDGSRAEADAEFSHGLADISANIFGADIEETSELKFLALRLVDPMKQLGNYYLAKLPDDSQVVIDQLTLRFLSVGPKESPNSDEFESRFSVSEKHFGVAPEKHFRMDLLCQYLEAPHLKFKDCFKRCSDAPGYSVRGKARHDFDIASLAQVLSVQGDPSGRHVLFLIYKL